MSSLSNSKPYRPNLEYAQYLNPVNESADSKPNNYLNIIEQALNSNNLSRAVKFYDLSLKNKIFLHIADGNLKQRLQNLQRSFFQHELQNLQRSLFQHDYLNKIEHALQSNDFTQAVKLFDETIEKNIFLNVEKDLKQRLQNIEQFLVKQDLLHEECLNPKFSIQIESKTLTESAGKITAFLLECLKNKKFALARIVFKSAIRGQFFKSNDPQNNKRLQELRSCIEEAMLRSSDRFRRDTQTHEIILLPRAASVIAQKAAEKPGERVDSKEAKDDKTKHQATTPTTSSSQRTERIDERVDSKDTKVKSKESEAEKVAPEETHKKVIKTITRYPLMPTEKRQGTDIQGNPMNLVFYR